MGRWDLSILDDAKDFLRHVRIGPEGEKLTTITLSDGTTSTLEAAPAVEIFVLAEEIGAAVRRGPPAMMAIGRRSRSSIRLATPVKLDA